MLTDSGLHKLVEMKSSDPVLSVYLNTEPTEGNADAYKLRLRNLLKTVNLPQDVSAVERYFNLEYNWSGRSVAVFSCAPKGFFQAYPLALPVHNMISVGERPSVKPLADLMDNYGGYGVILIDKQGARLFSFHMGELREQEGVLGELVKHVKRGGASTVRGQRGGIAGQTNAEDEIVERNMRESVNFAVRFLEENRVRRLLIGGTDDNIALFRSLLPKSWQSLIVGTFPMSMNASQTEVLNRTLLSGREAERQREIKLIETLIAHSAKGQDAVTGIQKTLDAINNGRVRMLVTMENFHTSGYACKDHGHLTMQMVDACTLCGEPLVRIPDAVEAAVHEAMRRGADVEIAHENQTLEQAGSIGAFLRF